MLQNWHHTAWQEPPGGYRLESFAGKFISRDTPEEVFSGRENYNGITRFVQRDSPGTILFRIDGACLNNGRADPRAGWAVWYGHGPIGKKRILCGRLEAEGPDTEYHTQTSNRAELRAALAALLMTCPLGSWQGPFFPELVIATDSSYVYEGSTSWAKTWVRNGWTTSRGAPVENQDLWLALLHELERLEDCGIKVYFWRIPREMNEVADKFAKMSATFPYVEDWGSSYRNGVWD